MSLVMTLPPTPPPLDQPAEAKGVLQSVPAWGSYLYQNFLLPALSPSLNTEWFNLGTPFGGGSGSGNGPENSLTEDNDAEAAVAANHHSHPSSDYTSTTNSTGTSGTSQASGSGPQHNMQQVDYFTQWPQTQPAPRVQISPEVLPQGLDIFNSAFNPSYFYQNPLNAAAISTSLLVNSQPMSHASSSTGYAWQPPRPISNPEESPIDSHSATPNMSPKGKKRRASSMDSDVDLHSHDEADHEVPEGVERDGMIWGMKVEDYRALSARERKRVRNRISARTFRAKRKEHLSSLEHTISNKDMQIKRAQDEAARLRQEVHDLKRRLAKYEQ